MRVSPPVWLSTPIVRWLPCSVLSELPPQGYVVELKVDGQERSIVVPRDAVKRSGVPPTTGELAVLLIAELPDDDAFGPGLLAELPSTPMTGSQRVKVKRATAKVA